jgi:hypothetical protein
MLECFPQWNAFVHDRNQGLESSHTVIHPDKHCNNSNWIPAESLHRERPENASRAALDYSVRYPILKCNAP